MNDQMKKVLSDIEKKLKPDRYQHTLGVIYTAAALAMSHGSSIENAMLAGLFHDSGKYGSFEKQIEKCRKYNVPLGEEELGSPAVIHSKLGAFIAKEKYGVEDEDVLNAIAYHTTGRAQMSLLEKIVYLADYMEPNRKQLPQMDDIRMHAFSDIDEAMRLCLASTIRYLEEEHMPIHHDTIDAYNDYKNKREVNG